MIENVPHAAVSGGLAKTLTATHGLPSATTRVVRPGETLYRQGDPARFVYRVGQGVVRTVSLSASGQRTVHGFHHAGEVFGIERGACCAYGAEAITAARLAIWRTHTLGPADLWPFIMDAKDRSEDRLTILDRASAFDRVLHFLLDMARRTRSGTRVDLPMSRYDMADYLGLSSETVSRVFTALRLEGLIAGQGRSLTLLEAALERGSDADVERLLRTFPRDQPE